MARRMPTDAVSPQPEYCRFRLQTQGIRANLQLQGDQIAIRHDRKVQPALIDPQRLVAEAERELAAFGPVHPGVGGTARRRRRSIRAGNG